jgi:hypothetical protein
MLGPNQILRTNKYFKIFSVYNTKDLECLKICTLLKLKFDNNLIIYMKQQYTSAPLSQGSVPLVQVKASYSYA